MSSLLKIPEGARRILKSVAGEALRRKLSVYLVGGAVRDFVMGRATRDLDFAVEGNPKPLVDFCAKIIGANPVPFDSFGTWRLAGCKSWDVDFATTRTENYPFPAALPVVKTPVSIKEDLGRRDFTINAMALKLSGEVSSEILDPFGGLKDIASQKIEILHDASFKDDPTRVFRAARYAGRFHFSCAHHVEKMALESLKSGYPEKLSRHRLLNEILKTLSEENPIPALALLKKWGYLDLLDLQLKIPSISKWRGLDALTRLGIWAFSRGTQAENFIASLPIEARASKEILAAIKIARSQESPRSPLPDLSLNILRAIFPAKTKSSLQALKISGADLIKEGIKPGPEMGRVLAAAAGRQWQGKIKSKREAVLWIRSSELGKK